MVRTACSWRRVPLQFVIFTAAAAAAAVATPAAPPAAPLILPPHPIVTPLILGGTITLHPVNLPTRWIDLWTIWPQRTMLRPLSLP